MKDAMGIVFTGEYDEGLKEIALNRSIASVPVGGRYRIIDFILSNMVNSGIRKIGVITQNNYHSLMDHLGSGKEWDLDRKHDGLFIRPPYVTRDNTGWYRGNVDALHGIMAYIRRSTQKYVVISGSHTVSNLTFNDAFRFHMDKDADITVLYREEQKTSPEETSRGTLLHIRDDGRIWDMEVKLFEPESSKVSMEMYILERELLELLVEEAVARGHSDFVIDILLRKLPMLKIYGYPYTGYAVHVHSVISYFRLNMDLLDPVIRYELFFRSGPVFTKLKNEVPAKYGQRARVRNCLVADGCIIEGEVENCILFRGVRIHPGAQVKNSIIMQETEVNEHASLEHVILDKSVIIRRGRRLVGQVNYPVVIGKGMVI